MHCHGFDLWLHSCDMITASFLICSYRHSLLCSRPLCVCVCMCVCVCVFTRRPVRFVWTPIKKQPIGKSRKEGSCASERGLPITPRVANQRGRTGVNIRASPRRRWGRGGGARGGAGRPLGEREVGRENKRMRGVLESGAAHSCSRSVLERQFAVWQLDPQPNRTKSGRTELQRAPEPERRDTRAVGQRAHGDTRRHAHRDSQDAPLTLR